MPDRVQHTFCPCNQLLEVFDYFCKKRFVRRAGSIKFPRREIWGDQRGLNPRQPESQSGALPTELWPPHSFKTFITYIENNKKKQVQFN
jgi:hypothetical protein